MATAAYSDPWIPSRLLVPWSSRVSFSGSVCGLPGRECGCWRYQACKKIPGFEFNELKKHAVYPAGQRDPGQLQAWLVVRVGPDGNIEVSNRDLADFDDWRMLPRHHSVAFGFEAPLERLQPVWLECLAWVEEKDEHQEITEWAQGSGEEDDLGESLRPRSRVQPGLAAPSLYDCFKDLLFRPFDLSALARGARLSIADLLGRYLDSRCELFRGHDLGQHLGVSWCHLQVLLWNRFVKERPGRGRGRKEPAGGGADPILLSHYGISFSYVEPGSRELQFLDGLRFGGLDFIQKPQERLSQYIHFSLPLIVGQRSERPETALTYADCLAPEHRDQILPTEIDRSYLTFLCEEISAYLLFWILARLLARPEPSQACADRVKEILGGESSTETCQALLESEICLPLEDGIFRRELIEGVAAGHTGFLGFFPRPVSFRRVLETVDLHRGGEPLLQVARFLQNEFDSRQGGIDRLGFRLLPMYRDLGWDVCEELSSLDLGSCKGEDFSLEKPNGLQLLAWILRSLGAPLLEQGGSALTTLARRLPRDSVFPFAHVLTHWPLGYGVRRYFIFPIWESVIDGQGRPSIFAHAFSRRPGETRGEIETEARYLQEQLLLFGRLIAQSYYDRKLQEMQIAGAIYNIGHPLKRRVDAVRASLNFLLDDVERNEETGQIVAHIHTAGRRATRVANLGHVLDVFSAGLTGAARSEIFLRKPEWHSFASYRLDSGLSQATEIPSSSTISRLMLLPVSPQSPGEHEVACWIPGEKGLFRPADLFYDEMLFELLMNAGKHGDSDGGYVEVTVSVEDIDTAALPLPALVFRNRCLDEARIGKLPIRPGIWTRWNAGTRAPVGGLFFLSNLLVGFNLGDLWAQVESHDDGSFFAVALRLNGLRKVG